MRKILVVLPLLFLASAARAQTQQDYHDWCYDSDATPGQTIVGCTELIDSGQYTGKSLASVYVNRATAYDDDVDADLTIMDSNKAVQLDPTISNAFNNLCHAYNGKGLYDQAITNCNQAIALRADYKQAYYNRGFAYEKQGNRTQAISDYRTSAKIDPNYASPANALKRLGVTN